jgi:hypothetical protein
VKRNLYEKGRTSQDKVYVADRSQDSSVGIEARQLRNWGLILTREKDFSLPHSIKSGSGVTEPPIQWVGVPKLFARCTVRIPIDNCCVILNKLRISLYI